MRLPLLCALMLVGCAHVAPRAVIDESNEAAKLLTELQGRLDPETAVELGVTGVDEQVVDWREDAEARAIRELQHLERTLDERRAHASSPALAVDLALLARAARQDWRGRELRQRAEVPFYEPARVIFTGLKALLDQEGAPAAWRAAVVRARTYAGLASGRPALTEQAEQRIAQQRDGGKPYASRATVERYLSQAPTFVGELRALFASRAVDAEAELKALEAQLAKYEEFVRREVLPRARADFHQPPELYAFALEERGIDVPPLELAAKAHAAFTELQAELRAVAAEVARQRGFADPDYRAVIRELKKTQLAGPALAELYRRRIVEIEQVLVKAQVVTIPSRPLAFRFATAAESAMMPAPRYAEAPLLKTGPREANEGGTFVLPTGTSTAGEKGYDDFAFDAAAWWLTAHEGRPGHDLQFSTMVEHPPSVARAVYAFNSVNVEGWGLYAEWLIEPLIPLEGKLLVLQARLMRAAHAFLDIELNLGRIAPEEVRRVMVEEVGFSEAWARTCLQRYTVIMPAQAPSYFYGYLRLRELRSEVERAQGPKFNAKAFHDAVLAQGLLSPAQLREALLRN
jgi:uncharacterized protein (DUF885 family)